MKNQPARFGDPCKCGATLAMGSPTVTVEGRAAIRAGVYVTSHSGVIVQTQTTVVIGNGGGGGGGAFVRSPHLIDLWDTGVTGHIGDVGIPQGPSRMAVMADNPMGELRHALGLQSIYSEGRVENAAPLDKLAALDIQARMDSGNIRIQLDPVPGGLIAGTQFTGSVDGEGRFSGHDLFRVETEAVRNAFRLTPEALLGDDPIAGNDDFESGGALDGAMFGDGRWTAAGAERFEVGATPVAVPWGGAVSEPKPEEPMAWEAE